MQRLQEELQEAQLLLSAREEGEGLLKAEVARLMQENGQLRDEALGLQERLAEARIHIVTTAPAAAPVPAVRELRALGILTGAGSDGIRDTWGPYGNGDMLERAMLVGLRNNLRRDDEVELALDICTAGGAAIMGLEGYGLGPGCRADAVLVEGETLAEAVVLRAPRKLVLKGGRVTARDGACVAAAP